MDYSIDVTIFHYNFGCTLFGVDWLILDKKWLPNCHAFICIFQAVRAIQGPQVRESSWSQKESRLQELRTCSKFVFSLCRGMELVFLLRNIFTNCIVFIWMNPNSTVISQIKSMRQIVFWFWDSNFYLFFLRLARSTYKFVNSTLHQRYYRTWSFANCMSVEVRQYWFYYFW